MKRILISIILAVALISAVWAGVCKTSRVAWSITNNSSKPQLKDVAVKGTITNGGKVMLTTVIVTYEIYRKSDNKMVLVTSANIDNLAPNAQASFVTRPAMTVEPQVNVNTAYTYRMKSIEERTSEK